MISAALIDELNDAVAHGTVGQRAKILHRVTELFVGASAGYSDDQIEIYESNGHMHCRPLERCKPHATLQVQPE